MGAESESNDEENETTDNNEEPDTSQVTPHENYSFYMKKNLMELPLPPRLKLFLNYDRAI